MHDTSSGRRPAMEILMAVLRHLGYGMVCLGYPINVSAAAQVRRTGPARTRRHVAGGRPVPPVWHPDATAEIQLTAQERHSLARHEEELCMDTSGGRLESKVQRILITTYLIGCPAALLLCGYLAR